jgi:hypothetical protein
MKHIHTDCKGAVSVFSVLCADPSEVYQNRSIIPPISVTKGPVLSLTVNLSEFQIYVLFLWVQ